LINDAAARERALDRLAHCLDFDDVFLDDGIGWQRLHGIVFNLVTAARL